jgi:hypothetical protein
MIQTSNPEFKLLFRASMQSELMTEPRGKSPKEKLLDANDKLAKYRTEYLAMANKLTKSATAKELQIAKTEQLIESLEPLIHLPFFSATAKKSIRRQWIRHKYNRYTSIDNKYTKKGKLMEEAGITMTSLMKGEFFKKNELRLYDLDGFITGEPDIYQGEDILHAKRTLDVKCSWNIDTFYDSISDKLKPVYDWQGIDYMHLTRAEEHTVCFCLLDTPYMIVVDEVKKETFGNWDGDMPKWAQAMTVMNHVYTKDTFLKYLAGLDIDPRTDGKEVQAVFESFVEMTAEERYFEHLVVRDDDKIRQAIDRNKAAMEYVKSELETGKFKKQLSEDE